MRYATMTAATAARLIHHGECVGLSGFSTAGAPKSLPTAIAEYAREEHAAGRPYRLDIMGGANISTLVEGVMAEAGAINHFMPYQGSPETRKAANEHTMEYVDSHLSLMAQQMRYGHLPRPTTAIIEVCDVTDDGELTLTTGVGNSPTYCLLADRIILELNTFHRKELRELHDIFIPEPPPNRGPIPLLSPKNRIGSCTIKVDPAKIVAVVPTHTPDHIPPFRESDALTDKIGKHIVRFLEEEYLQGRIAKGFYPLQSGVGNVANAALRALSGSLVIPPVTMYTEVLQDAVVKLMKEGRCTFASSCSLTVSDQTLQEIYDNFEFFREKIVLRPQEISNNPELARRFGLISMNTAVEIDLFGNVNSTHLFGNKVLNGVGGSADYSRSAAYTIFMTPSTAKGGAISSIVPMVSHTDQTEHDVTAIVTEYGVADLRYKSPREKAKEIIEHCAHPDYRPLLQEYLSLTPQGHTPLNLSKAFAMHLAFLEQGDMRKASFRD